MESGERTSLTWQTRTFWQLPRKHQFNTGAYTIVEKYFEKLIKRSLEYFSLFLLYIFCLFKYGPWVIHGGLVDFILKVVIKFSLKTTQSCKLLWKLTDMNFENHRYISNSRISFRWKLKFNLSMKLSAPWKRSRIVNNILFKGV